MTEFQVNDIVELTRSGKLHLIADAHQLECLLHKKTPMVLVYRPDAGVMDAFSADGNTAVLLEAAHEQGKCLCIAGKQVLIDGNEDRCYDRLSSGTLHPESALGLLEKRRENRDEIKIGAPFGWTDSNYDWSWTAPGHGGHAESPPTSVGIDIDCWAGVVGIERRSAETDEELRRRVVRELRLCCNGETDDAFRERGLAGILEPWPEWPEEQSTNCASCGDMLNERYERVEVVGGKRHHGMCADRVRSLAAEGTPKAMGPDPYTGCQLGVERAYAELMVKRNAEFVSRFTADTVPSEYREKFAAHPWSVEATSSWDE